MESPAWFQHLSPVTVKDAFGGKLCSYAICLEAWRRGLKVTINDSKFKSYTISSSRKSYSFNKSQISETTRNAVRLTKNKHLAKEYLEKKGVPVPKGEVFNKADSRGKMLDYADGIGYPVVIKPLAGSLGTGVFTNIASRDDAEGVIEHLLTDLKVDDLVVEQHKPGEDYRVYVIAGKVVGAIKRIPANITGDGKSTIQQLIDAKNLERKKNPFLSKGLIDIDREVLEFVEHHGYRLDSVPPEGEFLFLRGKANASAGGDTIDVTDKLPDPAKQAAIESIEAVPELAYCGVDVLYDESSGDFSVIELNARAQIGLHLYPVSGQARDIPKEIIDAYFPEAPIDHDGINRRVKFDIKSLLPLLDQGLAHQIVLPQLSHERDYRAYRYLIGTEDPAAVSRRVKRLALNKGLSGYTRVLDEGGLRVLFAGSRVQCSHFMNEVKELDGVDSFRGAAWKGLVSIGFKSL